LPKELADKIFSIQEGRGNYGKKLEGFRIPGIVPIGVVGPVTFHWREVTPATVPTADEKQEAVDDEEPEKSFLQSRPLDD